MTFGLAEAGPEADADVGVCGWARISVGECDDRPEFGTKAGAGMVPEVEILGDDGGNV